MSLLLKVYGLSDAGALISNAPQLAMSKFKDIEPYHHSCRALSNTYERVTFPLHYHLSRGDIIAFRRELRVGGVSPLCTDTRGRTPLELLIEQIEDLFITCLCTSFPVDDLLSTLKTECLFPAKFPLYDHREATEELYSDQQSEQYVEPHKHATIQMDRTLNDPRASPPLRKFPVTPPYPYKHDFLPSHIHAPVTKSGVRSRAAQQASLKAENKDNDSKSTTGSSTGEDAAFQQMVLMAVEDCLNRPLSHKILTRLKDVLQKFRVLIDLMYELQSCIL
eukprot:Blabericola_migrator_1__4754@NODE_2500_length_2675_cov_477_353911_g1519_i1_p1_GENE_NODE_2500_length_2675_cov_477_353911_g1519_i1NODE_2500_length_2675_cov_477_353911_g1519_i1_p1_ORF_typecomplete_len278_score29_96Gemini_C4/PF01492_17/25Gemini_C4/PF01492_17/25_NODE_2500_length_2675_cov_477_353911_g1519_i117312564